MILSCTTCQQLSWWTPHINTYNHTHHQWPWKREFNFKLNSSRMVMECAFGRLKVHGAVYKLSGCQCGKCHSHDCHLLCPTQHLCRQRRLFLSHVDSGQIWFTNSVQTARSYTCAHWSWFPAGSGNQECHLCTQLATTGRQKMTHLLCLCQETSSHFCAAVVNAHDGNYLHTYGVA